MALSRHISSRIILNAALFSLLCTAVQAEETQEIFSEQQAITEVRERWVLNLFFENDLFSQTDQQYTNGVRASWVSPDIDSFIDDERLPLWMRQANRLLTPLDPVAPGSREEVSRRVVFSLGQKMYTPDDSEGTSIDPDDRPYAGWLYAGLGYHTRTLNRLNSFEVNLGMVGPASLAEEFQNLVHDMRGFDRFNGWDNQLHNELGVQLVYEHKNRVFQGRLSDTIQQDLILHGGGSLGNVATYLNTGAQYRIGRNLPADFGTSALRPGGDNSVPAHTNGKSTDNWGMHGFVSMDGRWVLHDIFLDGNTFRSSHSVDKEALVGDLSIGVAATFDRWKLSYANIWRSKQFKSQASSHSYGSLTVSYSL
ncbi:lipid A deacylase LpxR family protein [Nitrincola sp.]|uniref:lipid A deacylase LpxR family protein n=1 Tax=Nitrincola sp. TaxID=1926584 RepID=UPI003A8D8DBE